MMKRLLLALLIMLLSVSGFVQSASCHESQPGTLELRQVAQDRYEVIWRAPIYYGRPHPARLELPDSWKTVVEPTERVLADSQVFRRVVTVGSQGVEGSIIRFPGLESTITDVFVRLNRLDGTTMTAVVRPSKPYAQLRGERTWYITAGEYIGLGFHHILQGIDHLLFVLGLLLIVKGRMTLLKTITAFTVAHSITLAIATLGYAQRSASAAQCGHRAQHSLPRAGDRPFLAGRDEPYDPLSLDRGLSVWLAARLWLCERPLHNGHAQGGTAARAALFQCGCRIRSACLCFHGPCPGEVVQDA